MKRNLLVLLLVVVFAGWIGTLIARDAGYVLISYDGITIQTGLWVMLGMLAGVSVSLVYLARLIRFFGGANQRIKQWGESKKRRNSQVLSSKGMIFLQEGNFERAEKFLISGAKESEFPAINYIAAAKAADKLGLVEKREGYLREALSSNPQSSHAVKVASAEMAADREEWQVCLDHLSACKKNSVSIELKKRALIALEDWSGLAEIMPQIKKSYIKESKSSSITESLEKTILIERLSRGDTSDESAVKLFKKAPTTLRDDEDVLKILLSSLENEKESELILRNALKQTWRSSLLEAYANLGPETLKKRLKIAEKWQQDHVDDSALFYCLGKLYEASGDRDQAKLMLERSVEIDKNKAASQSLAKLLAFDGDIEKSNEYFQLGNT
ncbi:MAG: HemY protein [Flavobacterium sp.]|jgi:HemY protein